MSNVKNLLVVLVLVVGSNGVAMDKKTNYKRSAHARKVQGRQSNNFEKYLKSLTAMSSGPKGVTKAYFSERQEELESYDARAGEPFEQIQEAKRKAQQDRMDMRVAANRLINFLQDELRDSCANRPRSMGGKCSNQELRSKLNTIDRTVKSVFLGK